MAKVLIIWFLLLFKFAKNRYILIDRTNNNISIPQYYLSRKIVQIEDIVNYSSFIRDRGNMFFTTYGVKIFLYSGKVIEINFGSSTELQRFTFILSSM